MNFSPSHLLCSSVVVATLVVSCLFGQNPPVANVTESTNDSREKEQEIRRNAEIDNIIFRARSLAPEASVDVMIDLLDSGAIKDSSKRKELIEDVFYRASEVREPLKLVKHAGLNDTRSGRRAMAFELDLDRLSIRLKAVRLMLKIDKPKAREMFDEIAAPKLAPLSCDDKLSYNLHDFYQILKLMTELTFSAEQQKRNEHIYYAASYVEAITSPLQIGPAIDVISTIKTTPQQFDILLSRLNYALRKMSGDPRSFGSAMKYGRINERIKFLLIEKMERSGSSSKQFFNVYRSFLAKHLAGVQCEDSLLTRTDTEADPIIQATDTLFETPLGPDEVKPEKVEPTAADFRYWTSPKASQLLDKIRKLRFGDDNKGLSEAQKNTQEWKEKLLKFLEEMDHWLPEDEGVEEDYLSQKAILYEGLLEITPDTMRAQILMNYLLFLRDSNTQKDDPLQWLVNAKWLMKIAGKLKGEERENFLSSLRSSGNEIFQLYIEIDDIKMGTYPN